MPTTYAAAWKKAKPLTLGSEPLSEAMKSLDAALAAYGQSADRERIAALSGAAKSAQRAAGETLKKCNPTLHKQGMAWLTAQEKELGKLIAAVAKDQTEFAQYMQDATQKKEVVVRALATASSKPSLQLANVAAKQAGDFGTWLNANAKKVTSKELLFIAQKATRAKDLTSNLAKALDKLAKNPDADEKKKLEAEVNGLMGEMKGIAKELATPVKWLDVKRVGARTGDAAKVF